ncbi:MAG: hypothetical protein KBG85_04555 [Micropruina sp.]|nr:hypothetical protein [Micropruina sp.]
MKASFAKRLRTWLIILLAVGLFGAGVVAAVGVSRVLPNLPYFGTDSSSRNTQIVHAVTRTEQVSLMSLGIQGISSKNQKSTFQGIDIPGSERASFIQYSFSAKLGIEGKSVKIAQVAASEYLVSVPKFVFIGHSDVDFRLVIESSGVVSWVTPKIDTVEMVNAILNDGSKDQYIIANSEILKDQAKSFYGRIVSSIDPSISLKFEFG